MYVCVNCQVIYILQIGNIIFCFKSADAHSLDLNKRLKQQLINSRSQSQILIRLFAVNNTVSFGTFIRSLGQNVVDIRIHKVSIRKKFKHVTVAQKTFEQRYSLSSYEMQVGFRRFLDGDRAELDHLKKSFMLLCG